jgi:hypothetical protein
MEPFRLGSLAGQTRLDIEIEDQLVDEFTVQFDKGRCAPGHGSSDRWQTKTGAIDTDRARLYLNRGCRYCGRHTRV